MYAKGGKQMKKSMIQLAILAQYGSQRNFAEQIGWSELAVSQVICKRKKLSRQEQVRWSQILRTPRRLLFPDQEKEVA
jgi:hypothetical protein